MAIPNDWRVPSLVTMLERVRRFQQHLIDLGDYLRSNWNGLRHYAAETRQGRRISSAMAESAMSHLVNQRSICQVFCVNVFS